MQHYNHNTLYHVYFIVTIIKIIIIVNISKHMYKRSVKVVSKGLVVVMALFWIIWFFRHSSGIFQNVINLMNSAPVQMSKIMK